MTVLALMIRPAHDGWGVYLTNGREVIHYREIRSKFRALRYLARAPADGTLDGI
jgi:hypothetical protein